MVALGMWDLRNEASGRVCGSEMLSRNDDRAGTTLLQHWGIPDMGTGVDESGRPTTATNNFRVSKHIWASDLSCPCCGQLKIAGEVVEKLELIAVAIGRSPKIKLGYLCHAMARNWWREHRRVPKSGESKSTGVRRIEARLPTSCVDMYKGTAVLLQDTAAVTNIARRLGFIVHQIDEGSLISLPKNKPTDN